MIAMPIRVWNRDINSIFECFKEFKYALQIYTFIEILDLFNLFEYFYVYIRYIQAYYG